MIGQTVLWEVVRPNLVRAVSRANLQTAALGLAIAAGGMIADAAQAQTLRMWTFLNPAGTAPREKALAEIIKRFELSFETARKAMRQWLVDQEELTYESTKKAVMEAAFKTALVSDADLWAEIAAAPSRRWRPTWAAPCSNARAVAWCPRPWGRRSPCAPRAVQGFFKKENLAFKEVDLLCPDGSIVRPDRVNWVGDALQVIDFKTGKSKPEHDEQIARYKKTLQSMGHQVTAGVLIYLETKELRYV